MNIRLENLIESIRALPEPDGWVRLEQVLRTPGRLALHFGIYKGGRGRKRGTGDRDR